MHGENKFHLQHRSMKYCNLPHTKTVLYSMNIFFHHCLLCNRINIPTCIHYYVVLSFFFYGNLLRYLTLRFIQALHLKPYHFYNIGWSVREDQYYGACVLNSLIRRLRIVPSPLLVLCAPGTAAHNTEIFCPPPGFPGCENDHFQCVRWLKFRIQLLLNTGNC